MFIFPMSVALTVVTVPSDYDDYWCLLFVVKRIIVGRIFFLSAERKPLI